MSKTALIENQWADIVIPSPPESPVLIWWLLGIGLVVVILFISRIVWLQTPRQRLKRSIRNLLRVVSPASKTDKNTYSKQILQQLERALCQFCNTSQLLYIQIDHSQWSAFREQLQQATYQAIEPDRKHIHDLLEQAQSIFLEAKKDKY